MILVDSSIWIDFFEGKATIGALWLEQAVADDRQIVTCPTVMTEVLQGFRMDHAFEEARNMLVDCRLLDLDREGHIEAAQLYRTLRRKGFTVRSTLDCIIAQTCILNEVELLGRDSDFDFIARHVPLRLVQITNA